MTKRIKTTKQQIVDYWETQIDFLDTNVSLKQATTHCWRCGVKRRLDRCHILAHALGGSDSPENFVLLCKFCHIDNPNIDDSTIVWDWIKAYKLPDGVDFWYHQGQREFTFIYGSSLDAMLETKGYFDRDEFDLAFKHQLTLMTHHFGQPRYNRATVEGAIKRALDSLENRR
ncbi:HNH endonuclease [Erysipelothrix anatis]|uniref:HNH endonuclease n=1 Tax=Erysipelothrix anatis TaxID=2683713 RepID=UPI0013592CF6|nr:HNH endonuclease signature motif containing protein [Erysipelothrix anatis]